jgi:hypothetical protein
MTFLLHDILASTKPWSLYCVIPGGHKCGNLLRITLQHVTYIPVLRFLIIVHMDYYGYYQFQRNPGPQYLWISLHIF